MNERSETGTRKPIDLLIRDVTVLRMVPGEPPLDHMDVAVTAGRIVAVKPAGAQGVVASRTIEGQGHVLMPGLVNLHAHLGMSCLRSSSDRPSLGTWLQRVRPVQQRLTSEDVYWFSLLSLAEMLLAGITTVADAYFFMDSVAEACVQSGIRACLAQGVIELEEVEHTYGPRGEQVDRAADFARRWNGSAGGRLTARLAPHSVYTVSPATLREIARVARSLDVGIHTHVSETALEVDQCLAAFGRTPPAHFDALGCLEVPFLAAHCVHLRGDDLRLLDRPGVGLAHNPASNMKLGSGRADLPAWLSCEHLAVGLGTDSAASNDALDIRREAYLTAVWHPWPEGTPVARVCLELATIGGAKALGLGDEIGSIEVGKRAPCRYIPSSAAWCTRVHRRM